VDLSQRLGLDPACELRTDDRARRCPKDEICAGDIDARRGKPSG
jgi:hypothetical protein